MQPPTQAPIIHNGLSYTLQKHGLSTCSKQVQSPSTHGPSSPYQGSQRKLHNVWKLQHRGAIGGFSQDARALQVQQHRSKCLSTPKTSIFHAGTSQLTQRCHPETWPWSIQPRESDSSQGSGTRLLSRNQTLRVCYSTGSPCF